MVGQGRTIGLILIAAGIIIDLAVIAWGVAGLAERQLQPTGFALLLVLVNMVLTLPLVGGGIFLMKKGGAEAVEVDQLRKEQRLVGMVESQGSVSINQAAAELGVSRDQLKAFVYDLVGKGLFTGYIDWKGGKLVAQDASQIEAIATNGTCPNCGGQVELGGKGVVRCPYCGSEIFLSAGAVAGGR